MADDLDMSKIVFTGDLPKDEPPKNPPKKSAPSRPVGRPTNASKGNEVEKNIGDIIKMISMPLKMRDIHEDGSSCADVTIFYDEKDAKFKLTKEGAQLAEAMKEVVVDSEFLMKVFTGGEILGKWGGLAFALWPVASTVYTNHSGGKNHGESPLG